VRLYDNDAVLLVGQCQQFLAGARGVIDKRARLRAFGGGNFGAG